MRYRCWVFARYRTWLTWTAWVVAACCLVAVPRAQGAAISLPIGVVLPLPEVSGYGIYFCGSANSGIYLLSNRRCPREQGGGDYVRHTYTFVEAYWSWRTTQNNGWCAEGWRDYNGHLLSRRCGQSKAGSQGGYVDTANDLATNCYLTNPEHWNWFNQGRNSWGYGYYGRDQCANLQG
jgi:hypothetical protein